jgi:hypothetical protein
MEMRIRNATALAQIEARNNPLESFGDSAPGEAIFAIGSLSPHSSHFADNYLD